MYTLYYAPGTCSTAVHVVLNELGVPFDVRKVTIQGEKSPELLKVNPRGSVPVLKDENHVIREGGAILVYLLDKHRSPLLPHEGTARATALEWLMFCNATLHPAFSRLFATKSMDNEAARDVLRTMALTQINKYFAEVEAHLAEHTYLAGEQATVADILFTVIAGWTANFDIALGGNVKRLLKAVIARPAYQKTLAEEGSEYKAAA